MGRLGSGPFHASSPAQTGVLAGEIEQLQGGIVVWKAAARFDDLAQGWVQRLNRVGGLDHFADVGREWHDMLPGLRQAWPIAG